MDSVSSTIRDYRNSKKVDTVSIMEEIRAEERARSGRGDGGGYE